MDLSIRRVAKTSSLSGDSFEAGELVESFLFRDAEGILERADLRRAEVEGWSAPGAVICRWQHRIKTPSDDEAESRRQSLASAEEMFLALAGLGESEVEEGATPPAAPPEAPESRERSVLLNLLALLLERKRVLKPVRGRPGHFLYGSEKRPVNVPRIDLDPREIVPLVAELDGLL